MSLFVRNTSLFAISQGLMISSVSMIIACAALVGQNLAADKSLATLPVAMMHIAAMLVSIPAALSMEKIGRKRGFMLATLLGFSGGALATWAIIQQQFWLFVIGVGCVGLFNGFGHYFRFAAADAVDTDYKSRAISFVLVGGLAAAFIGPNLANLARDGIEGAEFAGSYASLMVVYVLLLLTLSFLKLPEPAQDPDVEQGMARPLPEIISQPVFIVAVICAMFGYGVMSLVMTATPLAMHHHAHAFSDTSFVIQWHLLGMFVPSFFTGHLIRYFGIQKVLWTGVVTGIACVLINLAGTSVWHFWLALLLLGISWNFLFVGGTTLLTEAYRPVERAKTQALNDFLVFSTVALASLSAGFLQHQFGWRMVNIGVLPALGLISLSLLWLRYSPKPIAAN